MVRLRDIPRTATFAWSPGSDKPLVATGTRAGAVDSDFSDESKLELWDLSLDDQAQGIELQPLVSINSDARFYDIAWGPATADHPKGIIAGALENGSLDLWDAAKLIAGDADARFSQTTKHTGAIKTLEFNPLKPQILATAGAKGELFIYDVTDISNPFRLGNAAARSDDIECLAWNRKVSHILATGGAGGFVTVWDLKTKKASLTLNNNRKAVSALAWDPNNSTRLLTATPDDNTPVIMLWNLRNSNAPERTLEGHDAGILSLAWCSQDSTLLLSSGKDNKTIVWNPESGEKYGELPVVTNWTFQTRFNPQNPNLSATASFDGKITIQTLQNANPDTSQAAANSNLDDEDFFRAAQMQPQGASWSLTKAPQWYRRPIGASFGFGGKVVVFRSDAANPTTSTISISHFSVDSDVSSATEKFQEAIAEGKVQDICAERVEQAKTDEEKADWQVMQTLVGENPRPKIIEYLGFKEEDIVNGSTEKAEDAKEQEEAGDETTGETDATKKRLSKLFDGDDDEAGEEDDFLSNVPATKGAKTDSPFHLFSDSDTSVEKNVTKALMLGNFAKATDICLKEDRMADAFLIANCGGQELVEKVQAAYLAQKSGVPSYMRLLGSVIEKNLWDVVYNADLENWKETMAILCTFSDPIEFPDLCEALGDRILEQGERKDASFCYLVGSKLEKVVSIWTSELEEAEQQGIENKTGDSSFSVHARSLQGFIEKVTVFRHVTKFEDSEQSQTTGWSLAALYDKYTEYADILAAHGQLEVAQKYLDLLPAGYPAAEHARNRVKLATQKSGDKAAAAARVTAPTARQPANPTPSRPQQPNYGYQPTAPFGANPANAYAPSNPTPLGPQPVQPQQSYMPQPNLYQPSNVGFQPVQSGYQPPVGYQPSGYSTPVPPPIGGPPRASTPSGGPPKKDKETENWNDVPMVTKAAPRRPTPKAQPIASPFPPGPGQLASAPPAGPYGQVASPPPPPPKGSAPPRISSPLTGPPQSMQGPPRPSSTANQYAPPPPQPGAVPSPLPGVLPMRTASPYNAPPAGTPPSNRYAPAPSAPGQQQPPLAGGMAPPPPQGNFAPGPVNPYSQIAQQPPANQYGAPGGGYGAPPPLSQGPPPMAQQFPPGPPTGPSAGGPPPPAGPPRAGPPPGNTATPTPPPPQAAAAAPPQANRLPAGDRSQIPANAKRMVDILDGEMQRVTSKAPANFMPQVKDTQKRLYFLFDHLNNNELLQPATIEELSQLAEALLVKDYTTASNILRVIQRDKTEECGNWAVGVKRLISMSKATP